MSRLRLIAAAVLFVLAVAGCAASPLPAYEHPAARAVDALLALRRADVRDAAAYEPYFADPALAAALAEGSGEPTGTPRVPEWEPPYVSREESGMASVAVVWTPGEDFADWPAVTVFLTELADGRWVISDATETTAAPAPLGDASAGQPAQE